MANVWLANVYDIYNCTMFLSGRKKVSEQVKGILGVSSLSVKNVFEQKRLWFNSAQQINMINILTYNLQIYTISSSSVF